MVRIHNNFVLSSCYLKTFYIRVSLTGNHRNLLTKIAGRRRTSIPRDPQHARYPPCTDRRTEIINGVTREKIYVLQNIGLQLNLMYLSLYPFLSLGLGSSLVLLVVICLQSPQGFNAFPQMSLSNLFTNAVIRAQHLHQMVADTYRDYDIDLLRFSLTLLQSWMTPIQIVNRVFGNNQVFGNIDRVYDRLRDLDEGLHILIRELDDGNVRNYGVLTFTYDKFDVNLRSEEGRAKNYGLLSCFKKDMHKVETYLKVMKCRRFVESNCTF
ncbi:hypothetical protein AB205_0078640 [Aquarana catesbeiana]|uniref:Growth hormone n=2 Tax=Ranidae TaxID=8397 RepID=A0A2G9SF41_AQUCT|nr:hypothetical protein AB205_0078640 [Aquarana catesbeiana]